MKEIHSWERVVALLSASRNDGCLVSNFFPDSGKMACWCADGTFYEERCNETQFFLHRQKDFSNVYFMTKSPEALGEDLRSFMASNGTGCWVVDIVACDDIQTSIMNVFVGMGFCKLATMQRMSRTATETVTTDEISADVEVAEYGDVLKIKNILERNFEAKEKHLPSAEEIKDWISLKTLYVVRGTVPGEILGLIIFDQLRFAIHLRYWYVSELARGRGFGGRLLKAMLFAGARTRRQYLWVKTTNDNAIACYLHYGF